MSEPEAEYKLQIEQDKGRRAKECLDEFFIPFFSEKNLQLFEAMNDAQLGDSEILNVIHHQMKSLEALRIHLQQFIDTGKMAELSLAEFANNKKGN
jgi:hypothetical protein